MDHPLDVTPSHAETSSVDVSWHDSGDEHDSLFINIKQTKMKPTTLLSKNELLIYLK